MKKRLLLTLAAIGAAVISARAADNADVSGIDVSKLPPASAKKNLTFDTDIKPLLDASCIRCHGNERPKGGLRLTSREDALKGGKEGKVIVPGDSKKSLLVIAAAQIDPDTAMPPKRGPGRGGPGGGGRPGGGGKAPGAGGPGGGAPGGTGPRPGGSGGGGPGGPGGGFGPPPKPLTAEQVGVLRAWVDQGAK